MKVRLLAIDPGKDQGYCIVDENNKILDCGLGDPPGGRYSLVIIEKPQYYPNSRVDPNDLITLGIRVGRNVERFSKSPITLILPHVWKGNIPKKIHHGRILAKLTPENAAKVAAVRVAESKKHNVLDAVGLAMWYCSRLDWVLLCGHEKAVDAAPGR